MFQLLILVTSFSVVSMYDIDLWKELRGVSWVDEANEDGPINMDSFFDRLVLLGKSNFQPVAPGVFVTKYHILTSYNPFKHILATYLPYVNEFQIDNETQQYPSVLRVMILIRRSREKTPHWHYLYDVAVAEMTCARQVVPVSEKALDPKQWHGTDRIHSPTHDLLVLRVYSEVLRFIQPKSLPTYDDFGGSWKVVGPSLTPVASPSDVLGRIIKFASYGFLDAEHIRNSRQLRSREYEEDDNVVVECGEWFPRTWGHFICVRNLDDFPGVGSGAMLVSNNTLFGVGSFLLKKGENSILVFTDVRPYRNIILNTCELKDQSD